MKEKEYTGFAEIIKEQQKYVEQLEGAFYIMSSTILTILILGLIWSLTK